jgi:hypothetical protein
MIIFILYVSAPFIFPYIYAFIKPMLSGHTLSKVKIFDDNIVQWKPALLERIPEQVLIEQFPELNSMIK